MGGLSRSQVELPAFQLESLHRLAAQLALPADAVCAAFGGTEIVGDDANVAELELKDANDFTAGSNALHEGKTVSRASERLPGMAIDRLVPESQTIRLGELDGFGDNTFENSFKVDGDSGDVCAGFGVSDFQFGYSA